MKALLHLSILAFLIAIVPGRCMGEMEIEHISRERAKELGLEVRASAAGRDEVKVELQFDTAGELKSFSRVDLEWRDGGRVLLSAPLREQRPRPGHIVVSFTADSAKLGQLTLRVVTSEPPLGGSGYELSVKEFVDLQKTKIERRELGNADSPSH